MSGLLCWMTWSVWMLKSHNISTLSFSTPLAGLWLYHLNLPTSKKCKILAILLCLCLYSFWVSFLHYAIKWVIDSSLFPYILHFSDTSWSSMFFLFHLALRACSCVINIKPCFFLQITFPNPFPCLLNSDFFCFSHKFTMELFLFPLLVSFFLFLFVS